MGGEVDEIIALTQSPLSEFCLVQLENGQNQLSSSVTTMYGGLPAHSSPMREGAALCKHHWSGDVREAL